MQFVDMDKTLCLYTHWPPQSYTRTPTHGCSSFGQNSARPMKRMLIANANLLHAGNKEQVPYATSSVSVHAAVAIKYVSSLWHD